MTHDAWMSPETLSAALTARFWLVGWRVGGAGASAAEEARRRSRRPRSTSRAAQATSRDRRARGRLLLGRAGRLPARRRASPAPSPAMPAATRRRRITRRSSTGTTGHAESVRITFDPRKISYGRLLQIYFSVAHDPTELNRQGPDDGTQYRSAIFPPDAEQARVAKAYIAQLDQAHVFDAPIVTKIEPGRAFYPAEAYHQDFLTLHPTYPYIVINDLPKVEQLNTSSRRCTATSGLGLDGNGPATDRKRID